MLYKLCTNSLNHCILENRKQCTLLQSKNCFWGEKIRKGELKKITENYSNNPEL